MLEGLPASQITSSSSEAINLAKQVPLSKPGWSPAAEDNNRWIQFEFSEPTEINGVILKTDASVLSLKTLTDGAEWETFLVSFVKL